LYSGVLGSRNRPPRLRAKAGNGDAGTTWQTVDNRIEILE
jgi:hypothetical protein